MKTILFLLLTMPLFGETIPISTSVRATPIGTFKFGDIVSIQYQKGEWSRRVQNAPVSPDTAEWKELRVVVFWEDRMGNRVVTAQPFLTKEKPHLMKVDREGQYFIRMAEPRDTGVGVVFYKVEKVETHKENK